MEEGWGFPELSKKAHYFVEGRSLCGRWAYTGALEPAALASPDDCAACTRKLTKRGTGCWREKEVASEDSRL